MSIAVYILYKGQNGSAKKFAKEMIDSGTVQKIREEEGNLGYDYYIPFEKDSEFILLVDKWENQAAIDAHHASPMMNTIIELRDKYNLTMEVERFISDTGIPETDEKFIRK